ncbi:MAG: hypothetical protein LBC02_04440 [Planctomycetaceae bacterium]|jgi:hypothetical protein|nr:hypothetical protein [Planctomycetaceae bacterium]
MLTDTEIKCAGMRVLTERLGIVEAERFIALMLHEPFDYTEWQQDLYSEKSYTELRDDARQLRENKKQKKWNTEINEQRQN